MGCTWGSPLWSRNVFQCCQILGSFWQKLIQIKGNKCFKCTNTYKTLLNFKNIRNKYTKLFQSTPIPGKYQFRFYATRVFNCPKTVKTEFDHDAYKLWTLDITKKIFQCNKCSKAVYSLQDLKIDRAIVLSDLRPYIKLHLTM